MDVPRLYCGDKNPVPPGYAGYDTRFRCLRKGVGIGLYKIRQNNNNPPPPLLAVNTPWYRGVPWWAWAIFIGLFLIVVLVLVLFFLSS